MADEIVKEELKISYEKAAALKEYRARLQNLFRVLVTIDSPHAARGICWIHLQGQKTDVSKAKIYIQSFCDPETKVRLSIPDRFYVELLMEYTTDVERDSQAVVTFPSREEVLIQGSELAVAMASSMIDQKLPGLKSERRNPVQSGRPVIEMDPALTEFAIKLGYSEQDIHQVVRKLGADVDQNTMLHELIKISTCQRMQLSAQARQNADAACSGATAGSNTYCAVRSISSPRSSQQTLYEAAASSPCLVKQHVLKRAAQDGQGLMQGPKEEREQKSDGPIDDESELGAPLRKADAVTCSYGRRCTFGSKCRFSHPERFLTLRSQGDEESFSVVQVNREVATYSGTVEQAFEGGEGNFHYLPQQEPFMRRLLQRNPNKDQQG